mgnify:FL=1|tara:strand:- start:27 stop:458 length:432 start_codon:yes stop_codon:yes gene_type:complete
MTLMKSIPPAGPRKEANLDQCEVQIDFLVLCLSNTSPVNIFAYGRSDWDTLQHPNRDRRSPMMTEMSLTYVEASYQVLEMLLEGARLRSWVEVEPVSVCILVVGLAMLAFLAVLPNLTLAKWQYCRCEDLGERSDKGGWSESF